MNTKDFFNDEENMKKFLRAKTEEEARKFLESKCGEISDEKFSELKKELIEAVEDSELEKASGGGSTIKKLAIGAIGIAMLAGATGW